MVFWLRAAQEGEGEVQVVVRQDNPLPLATLRLTATVLPRSAEPVDRAACGGGRRGDADSDDEHRRWTRGSHAVREPSDPGHRREPRRGHLGALLRPRPARLPGRGSPTSWRTRRAVLTERVPQARCRLAATSSADRGPAGAQHAAFHESLRTLGAQLALDVLPPDLLRYLRDHLDDIDELAVITSGETDIPWELVYVWDGGRRRGSRRDAASSAAPAWSAGSTTPATPRDLSVRHGPRATTSSPSTSTPRSCSTRRTLETDVPAAVRGHCHRPAGRRRAWPGCITQRARSTCSTSPATGFSNDTRAAARPGDGCSPDYRRRE